MKEGEVFEEIGGRIENIKEEREQEREREEDFSLSLLLTERKKENDKEDCLVVRSISCRLDWNDRKNGRKTELQICFLFNRISTEFL